MAIENKIGVAKEVLGNTRSRMVVIILGIIVVSVLIIAYVKFKQAQQAPAGMGSAMTGVPEISSIPGVGNPTREYAKLQEQQNLELAAEASRTGTSAMPTVVRTTYLDTGVSSDLSKESGAASSTGCGVEELKRARASGVSAVELRCRGCSLAALRAAGYNSGELRAAGFSAQELKNAGFGASELRDAGFSASELKSAGYSVQELANAGYVAGELKNAGFSAADLQSAGFSDSAIRAAGFNLVNTSSSGECDAKKLQAARSRGVAVAELKKLGCSAAALRVAGYSAAELKAAGFSAAELKDAGFGLADLRAAGFSAAELREAGFSAKELKAAGFSAADLKSAGFSAGELNSAGFTASELKEAGFSAAELRAGGFSATDLAAAGFSPSEMQAAGYSEGDLVRAGVVANLGGAEVTDVCSVDSLKNARKVGMNASALRKRGCSASAMKAAGYSATELKNAGFNAAELSGAGFSLNELRVAGYTDDDLVKAGIAAAGSKSSEKSDDVCSVSNLRKARAAGTSAAELKNRSCDASALKAAGFSAAELKAAGFSAAELKAAGFSAKELKAAGFSAAELKAAGFSAKELKAAGFSAADLYASGFSPDSLKEAGFSSRDIAIAKLQADSSKEGDIAGDLESAGRMSDARLSEMTDDETRSFVRQQQSVMSGQANQLFSVWTQIPSQQYVQGEIKESKASQGSKEEKDKDAVDIKNSNIYKTGSIIFAVLDTEVNSDEASPVMATVIQGPLKGSKVVGNFQLAAKKLLLQFKIINIPRLDTSVAINAVAVDPSTSKPTMASSVDNHYMLRYGTMLGSAFIQGLGQAVQDSGSTVATTTTGTVTSKGSMSTLGKTLAAFGTAAQSLGTAMHDKVNTPPTVKLSAGVSIGLMLMADLIIPKKVENDQSKE